MCRLQMICTCPLHYIACMYSRACICVCVLVFRVFVLFSNRIMSSATITKSPFTNEKMKRWDPLRTWKITFRCNETRKRVVINSEERTNIYKCTNLFGNISLFISICLRLASILLHLSFSFSLFSRRWCDVHNTLCCYCHCHIKTKRQHKRRKIQPENEFSVNETNK